MILFSRWGSGVHTVWNSSYGSLAAFVLDCVVRRYGTTLHLSDGCKLWTLGLLCCHHNTQILHCPVLCIAVRQRSGCPTMVGSCISVCCSLHGHAVWQETKCSSEQEATQWWQDQGGTKETDFIEFISNGSFTCIDCTMRWQVSIA